MTDLLIARDLETPGRLKRSAIDLRAGELTCLVGPNGSGKSSLLAALAGIPPSHGRVTIDGLDPHRLGPMARQRLFTLLSPGRELPWPLLGRDLIALQLPAECDWSPLIERLGLAELLDRRVDRLSTGERGRILLARALAPGPALLLLDEPVANLDPYWQIVVMELLRELACERRKAVFVALHDLRLAQQWGDRLVLMSHGLIAGDAPPGELLASSLMPDVFGVEWTGAEWTIRRPAGRRSSP